MNKLRRWPCLGSLAVGLTLAALSGCQTWVPDVGMTLPSGHYLQHQPQYIPPTPAFPLSRELATMEAQEGAQGPVPAAPAGVPVVPGPVGQ
jgi:hypothetical protein